MAWLEGDARNISSGWSPEPKLEAPNIGATLSAILTNRRVQQQQTQEALTAAIKAQQDRNQASAYGSALQSAGVVPGGVDVSNMSGPDLSRLAALYQGTIPDTDLDALHQAMTARENAAAGKENTIADYIKQYGRTPGARTGATPDDTPQTYTDDYGREWRLGTGGHWFLVPKNQSKQTLNAQADAAPSLDLQTITPDEPTPPAANPDVTITPPPSTTPPKSGAPPADTAAGHAPTYGKPVSDQDVAALGWARTHPDDPRSAAILQRLGIQ